MLGGAPAKKTAGSCVRQKYSSRSVRQKAMLGAAPAEK